MCKLAIGDSVVLAMKVHTHTRSATCHELTPIQRAILRATKSNEGARTVKMLPRVLQVPTVLTLARKSLCMRKRQSLEIQVSHRFIRLPGVINRSFDAH